jgi:hypothetical protein
MKSTMDACAVLDRIYLEVRSKLLDVAACLDRVERAPLAERVETDARFKQLQDGITILASRGSDRAERIQMLFSDAYVAHWNRQAQAARGSNGR